jgi:hypothetical protein
MTTQPAAEYVRVPLVLVDFITERFIAVDTADKLALAALKSYVQAAREEGR